MRYKGEHPHSVWGGVFVVLFVVLMALLYTTYSGWMVRMWLPATSEWPSPAASPAVTPLSIVG